MITSIFKKSTPINYILVVILVIGFYFLYQFQSRIWTNSLFEIITKIVLLTIILGSLFLSNFIVKKNGITKDSTYTLFFYFILLLFFPSILDNFKLLISNFLILLALRRLVSLQTLKSPKEKIFDASLWIFIASIFHFWAILFIFLVYVSIFFHVSRDYRNWLVPFVALFTSVIIFIFCAFVVDVKMLDLYLNSTIIHTEIDYFQNQFQNISISIFTVFVVFFVFPSIFSLSKKPLNLQSSYKKNILTFIIGIAIFLISPNKSNDILIFTFFPLSVMATNFIEYSQNKIQQEIVLSIAFILALICFFIQL